MTAKYPLVLNGTAIEELQAGDTLVGVGTVTSVSGTAPISVATGTSTPAISISQATTSTNGYLSSTDWNTFNGKQASLVSGTNIKTVNSTSLLGSGNLAVGTVTSVGATVPTGLTVSGSPITSSGTLAITYTAGYAIPTTAKQTEWDTAYSVRQQWNGGSTNLVASTGRTSLGGTTVGQNFFTLTNPSAITFPRMNADNTVSSLSASDFRTAIGAGTSSTTGTVTSVSGTGTVSGLTLTGTVTSSGSLTLGGNLSITADMIYNSFTATASQTTFTPTNTYTSGKIDVFANGIKMVNGADVTVTSGTSVVFATGVASGTRVDLVYPI
jgi:cytoskeletal protein CcmA (bactofilin family)